MNTTDEDFKQSCCALLKTIRQILSRQYLRDAIVNCRLPETYTPDQIYWVAKMWLKKRPVLLKYKKISTLDGSIIYYKWMSRDQRRQFRPPIFKPYHKNYQANFEFRPKGKPHLPFVVNLHVCVKMDPNHNYTPEEWMQSMEKLWPEHHCPCDH
jgi:hypothetical protein